MTDFASPHTRSLQDVLRNVSAEIARVSAMMGPIETAFENGSMYGTRKDRAVLQNLDLIVQTIENVASFLTRVGQDVPEDIRIEIGLALAEVRLEASRERLAAYTADGSADQDPLLSGGLTINLPSGSAEFF